MNQQIHKPDATIPVSQQEKRSPTLSSENSSRNCVSLGRLLLILLAIVVIVVMVVGIILVVHQFYHEFGGHGFLKARIRTEKSEIGNETNIYLPLRAIEALDEETSNRSKKSR